MSCASTATLRAPRAPEITSKRAGGLGPRRRVGVERNDGGERVEFDDETRKPRKEEEA